MTNNLLEKDTCSNRSSKILFLNSAPVARPLRRRSSIFFNAIGISAANICSPRSNARCATAIFTLWSTYSWPASTTGSTIRLPPLSLLLPNFPAITMSVFSVQWRNKILLGGTRQSWASLVNHGTRRHLLKCFIPLPVMQVEATVRSQRYSNVYISRQKNCGYHAIRAYMITRTRQHSLSNPRKPRRFDIFTQIPIYFPLVINTTGSAPSISSYAAPHPCGGDG